MFHLSTLSESRKICSMPAERREPYNIVLRRSARHEIMLAGLKWQDVDVVRETILLRDTKSGKNRTVYMTERIKGLFSGMTKCGPDALVFPDRNGKTRKEVGEIFRLVVEKLGLNSGIDDDRLKCVFHSLRHTHASRLLESGVDIYRVKELCWDMPTLPLRSGTAT